jgi:sterol 3beta-glucosyltransferase
VYFTPLRLWTEFMKCFLPDDMSKRSVIFLASGTRGDVQPYVALAHKLIHRGQPAIVATHIAFRSLVNQAGVPYTLLEDNPSDLLAQPRFNEALRITRNPLRSLIASVRYMREGRVWYARLLRSAWAACQNAALVIGGVPTLWASSIAQALGVPHLFAFLQPITRTAAFPSTLLPNSHSLGAIGNKLSHHVFEQATWLPWRSTINRWRREILGLPELRDSPLRQLHQQTVLYGYSAHVSPRPGDWPNQHHITGYWFDPSPSAKLSGDVERFLTQNEEAVYIGFGVGSLHQPQRMLSMIEHALTQTNLHAIVLWPQPKQPNDKILFVQHVAHEALFAHPSVRAAVHHGGAGTTAQAMRAGVPSLVLPAMADQYFWGGRVAALGIGPKPIPQHALTIQQLVDGLRSATHDEGMRKRAQSLSKQIRNEDGIERAADIICSVPLKFVS